VPILGSQGSGTKGAPTTPVVGTATVTNATTVSLTFTAPSSKLPITSYTVTSSPSIALSTSGTSSPLTVTGSFASGQAYTFTITATSSVGTSAASAASNSITPFDNPSWINSMTSTYSDQAYGVAVDLSNNVYAVGLSLNGSSGSNWDIILVKYNYAGVVQWQKNIGSTSSGNNEYGYYVTVDSSNVYIAGEAININGLYSYVAKFNSSGETQWVNYLGNTSEYTNASAKGVAVDSSGNVYVVGQGGYPGNTRYFAVKFNSSGTVQWNKFSDNGSPYSGYMGGIAVDSSGNVHLSGAIADSSSHKFLVVKLNSSGNLVWQRRLGSNSATSIATSCALDSSGNVYVTGTTDVSSVKNFLTAKWDSSGNLQWQRTFDAQQSDWAKSIAVDSSSNVYVVGITNEGTNNTNIASIKYNSSGALQWQRSLIGTSVENGEGIAVDTIGNYYIAGTCGATSSGNQREFFVAKLPADGSKTGTYTLNEYSLAYASSSYSDSAGSLSGATPSSTIQNGALPVGGGGITNATATLTSTTVTI
jgi:hypothetical protein